MDPRRSGASTDEVWRIETLDPGALPPTDPLDVHGMRAGVTDLDHGSFRAATTVAPADLTESVCIEVPGGDLVQPSPMPSLISGRICRSTLDADGEPLDLRADVLIPAPTPQGPGAHPIVVFVPGGGFVQSPRRAALLRRAAVASRGFVVVSVEYRTLRHGTAFDGVADVAAAVDWARAAAPRLGGEPSSIALWGESAGGYLAALAVTTGAAKDVGCVVDSFGLTDLSQVAMDFDETERDRHRSPEITEALYVFGRGSGLSIDDDPAAVQRANPVAQVTGAEPPFLLLHGDADGLVSPGQTQLLHRALLANGVESSRYVVAGAGHYGLEWSSRTVTDLIVGHLERHLRPKGQRTT